MTELIRDVRPRSRSIGGLSFIFSLPAEDKKQNKTYIYTNYIWNCCVAFLPFALGRLPPSSRLFPAFFPYFLSGLLGLSLTVILVFCAMYSFVLWHALALSYLRNGSAVPLRSLLQYVAFLPSPSAVYRIIPVHFLRYFSVCFLRCLLTVPPTIILVSIPVLLLIVSLFYEMPSFPFGVLS